MSKKALKEQEQREAVAYLQKHLKAGNTVYTVLRHVSRSGMMRHISVKAMINGEITDISWYVAKALDYPLQTDAFNSLKVGGCGMDMGFHVVHSLSYKLFPDGYKCLGRANRCPASDHVNYHDERGSYRRRIHKHDGYALHQK